MKLKKVTTNDPVSRVALNFHESTTQSIKDYQQMYQATYGDPITQSHLIEEVLKDFFTADKVFQKFLASRPSPDQA